MEVMPSSLDQNTSQTFGMMTTNCLWHQRVFQHVKEGRGLGINTIPMNQLRSKLLNLTFDGPGGLAILTFLLGGLAQGVATWDALDPSSH